MEGNESNLKIIEPDASCVPSPSVENDFRINCTDIESVRSILDVTQGHVSELSNLCSSSNQSEFFSRFNDAFKDALQENIAVNGFPLRLDKSSKLTSKEKEDHIQLVDDAMIANLRDAVSDVARKRKTLPKKCSKILEMQMKHDLHNLKTSRVPGLTESSLSAASSSPSKNRNSAVQMKFKEFCKNFASVQETVHQKLQKRNKLAMEISLASDIKRKRPLRSNSVGSLQQIKAIRKERQIHSENN